LEGILRGAWGVLAKRLYQIGGVKHFKAESLRLYSSSLAPFHVDGENVGELPATFSIRRQALKVIVP
jgi:diacylglycerol kinase family enzyme